MLVNAVRGIYVCMVCLFVCVTGLYEMPTAELMCFTVIFLFLIISDYEAKKNSIYTVEKNINFTV